MRIMRSSRVSRRTALGLIAGLAADATARAAPPTRVCLLGDSITSGYGLPAAQALPKRLEAELAQLGRPAQVVGAGLSGATVAGSVRRVERAIATGAKVCVVALGGNDLLNGAEPSQVRANLDQIVRRLKGRGITVVLTGVRAPPVLSGAWARAFNDAFASVAREHGLLFLPDLLAGVALRPELNQRDGIHPNAAGVGVIARRLAPLVARALG